MANVSMIEARNLVNYLMKYRYRSVSRVHGHCSMFEMVRRACKASSISMVKKTFYIVKMECSGESSSSNDMA